MKRFLSILFALIMLIAAVPQMAIPALAAGRPEIVNISAAPMTVPAELYGWEQENYENGESYFHYTWYDDLETVVTFSDGGTVTATGTYLEYQDYSYWLAAYDDQDMATPWIPGGTYAVQIVGDNVKAETTVTVGESLVQEVAVSPIVIDYGTCCDEKGSYDQWGNYHTYTHYYWENRVSATVTLRDGTVLQGETDIYYDGEHRPFRFVDDQSLETPWGVGTHMVTIRILGYQVSVPVEIRDVPVEGTEFKPLRVYAYEAYEKQEYDQRTGAYLGSYLHYEWRDYLRYTVTFADGTTMQGDGYGVSYNDNWYAVEYTDTQSVATTWVPGNTYTVTVSFMNRTYELPVQVLESPIVQLQIPDLVIPEGKCGYESDWWIYDWERLFSYTLQAQDGQSVVGTDIDISYQEDDWRQIDGWIEMEYDDQYEIPWTVGNTYTVNAQALGYRTSFTVSIVPREEIETPVLTLGKMENLAVYDRQEGAQCLYTPTESGMYRMECHGDEYVQGSFFRGDTLVESFSGYQPARYFRLESGTTYRWQFSYQYSDAGVLPVTLKKAALQETELILGEAAQAEITEQYGVRTFTFTPETSGEYRFRIQESSSTDAQLIDGDGVVLTGVSDANSQIVIVLKAGKTYYLDVRYTNGSTGMLDVRVDPMAKIVSIQAEPISIQAEQLGNYTEDGYRYNWTSRLNLTVTLSDGTTYTGRGNRGYIEVDGIQYPVACEDTQGTGAWWLPGGTYTATVTVEGICTQVSVSIKPSPIESLTVKPIVMYEKSGGYHKGGDYYYYEWSRMVQVTASFTDGTVSSTCGLALSHEAYGNPLIVVTDDQSEDTPWGVGTHTGTLRVLGALVRVPVEILPATMERISYAAVLESQPYRTEYTQGESLDMSGFAMRVYYSDGTEIYVNEQGLSVEGYDPEQIGKQTVTVTCEGVSVFFTVTVYPPKVSEIYIRNYPKTQYLPGEPLDLTGMEVVARYENGTEEVITDYTVKGFEEGMSGSVWLEIIWEDYYTGFTVYVDSYIPTPNGIYLYSYPYKTLYTLGEALDLYGMVIMATYDNGVESPVSDYTVSGYDPNMEGYQNIFVTWNGYSTEFSVCVEQPKVVSIAITKQPDKLTYICGEALDLTGMEVTAYFSDGSSRIVTDYGYDWFDSWMTGSQKLNITWEGWYAELYVTVQEAKPTGIAIRTYPWRTTYQMGEMLDLGGLEVVAYYSNGMESNLYEYDYTVEGFDSWNPGMQTVHINWNGWTAEFYVTVEEPIPTSLYIQTYPWQTTYQQGEELNLEGMEVYACYSNGEIRQVWDYTVENYDAWMVGPQIVTMSWNGLYADFTVTVEEPVPVSLEMLCAPWKTVYQMGEELDMTGLELAVNYSNGRRDTVYDYTAEGYDPWMEGAQTVRLNWNGYTVEFYVVVEPPVPTGIEIRTYPQKNVYLMGEELDLYGLEVVAYYNNGTQTVLCDYTVEGFDSWMTGMQTIRVSWNGYTAEFYVTVEEPIPTQLEIRTYPHKLTYQQGEEFDFTGTELVAWYNNGSDKFVYEYTLEGYDPWMIGVQTVRFSWNGLSVDFMVTVEAPVPVELTVDKLPDKTVYAPGEELDLTGMEVVVHYQDGKKETVTDYLVEGFEAWRCGPQKVRLYWGSLMTEFEVVVEQMTAIVMQPQAVHAETGTEVQFHVETTGEVVSWKWEYRKVWKWFNTSMTGYNTDTLTVTATGARNGYDYRCIITFADGTELITEPAELTVNTYITEVVGPNDQTVVNGYKGQFTASAQGEGIQYAWQYKRPGDTGWYYTTMEGNNKPTVLIETNAARDGYQYRCEIKDVTGNITVYTEPATMRVLSFKEHPAETFSATNGTVQFTVATSVDSGFTYQWQYSKDGVKWTNTTMTGYNTDTLTVAATKARNGYQYRCVLTGSKNSKIESKAAVLHVGDPVVITAQPANVTVAAGEVATFTVVAENAYAYQWQYQRPTGTAWGNTGADGNKTATLHVTTKATNNGYKYRCIIYGLDGTETITEFATLTIG